MSTLPSLKVEVPFSLEHICGCGGELVVESSENNETPLGSILPGLQPSLPEGLWFLMGQGWQIMRKARTTSISGSSFRKN